jgi:dipeptidyl aminopeptidase/acylaminoacyl peptidase
MRMRTTVSIAALLLAALWAAPAQAKLVYVKQADTAEPVVYVATDKGKKPRRLGIGRAPAISPDGRWVAFITVPNGRSNRETVVLKRLRQGSQRFLMRSKQIASLRFSPDSGRIAAVANGRHIRVYDIANDKRRVAASGDIRGYAWAPDAKRVVFGEADGEDFQAASDLYVARAMGGADPDRLTRTRDAVNPVWGQDEIFFDRFEKREGDAPAYNLFAVDPATREVRRLTDLTIPALVSGLVPLEVAADGRRMLSVFTGQDTQVGFTVNTRSGDTRALSMDFERGIVGYDLSADGKTILGHTGGPDPGNAHDVITLPYGGGEETVVVQDAAYPDWTR